MLGKNIKAVSILARTEMRALRASRRCSKASKPVSILARTEMRALRTTISRGRAGINSFNPRPHRDAGATDSNTAPSGNTGVSILARTEMRALRASVLVVAVVCAVSILARTEMRALLPDLWAVR